MFWRRWEPVLLRPFQWGRTMARRSATVIVSTGLSPIAGSAYFSKPRRQLASLAFVSQPLRW